MSYVRAFRNTVFSDILEALGIVGVPSSLSTKESSVSVTVCTAVEAKEDSTCSGAPSGEVHDPFLVTWSDDEDPDHPHNFPTWKKAILSFTIFLLTGITYMGSSIYVSGQVQVQEVFGVGSVVATLSLSLFVLGYGVGPMIFSPLSEIPAVGRNYTYIPTLALFVILQIPAALSPTYAGLVISRFLAGLVSSCSLSTGGATLGDFSGPKYLPVLVAGWNVGMTIGPATGPLLGAAMVDAQNYKLIFWFLMATCGSMLLFMFFFFPETSHQNLLVRKARRVRRETGDKRFYAQVELEENMTIKKALHTIAVRPAEIFFLEPGVMAIDIYMSLTYGCFYLFFEASPLVFVDYYHFTLVESGLSFIGFQGGAIAAFFVLVFSHVYYIWPKIKAGTMNPEEFLTLAKAMGWLCPSSLFLFAWTAQVHWILPIIWEGMFVLGAYSIFQAGLSFLAVSYPRYMASVFAGNNFLRGCFAAAFPLFGPAMYRRLGSDRFPVGWGGTLLGFISLALTVIPFVLYSIGPKLRGRSKYAN